MLRTRLCGQGADPNHRLSDIKTAGIGGILCAPMPLYLDVLLYKISNDRQSTLFTQFCEK